MSKIIDVRKGGGEVVVRGTALVLPSSSTDGVDLPLDGSTRFNPVTQTVELYSRETWGPITATGGDEEVITHSHSVVQITGLAAALDAKSAKTHPHLIDEITGLQDALDSKSPLDHVEAIANIVSLQETLDGVQTRTTTKADLVHTHAMVSITGLAASLDGKSGHSHTHQLSSIEGFVLNQPLYKLMQLSVMFTRNAFLDDEVYLPICVNCRIPKDFSGVLVNGYRPNTVVRIRVTHCGGTGEIVLGHIVLDPTQPRATFELIPSPLGYHLMAGDYLKFDSNDWALLSNSLGISFQVERV